MLLKLKIKHVLIISNFSGGGWCWRRRYCLSHLITCIAIHRMIAIQSLRPGLHQGESYSAHRPHMAQKSIAVNGE